MPSPSFFSSFGDQIEESRRSSRLLHCQALAVSYRRALKGLPPGPRKSKLQAALKRTLAEIRAGKTPRTPNPAPAKRNTRTRLSGRRPATKRT